jgi:hypothetical protein
MSADRPSNYEVGYKKPPREHQFRKGQASPRKGKPGAQRAFDIGALLREPVELKVQGQRVKRDEFEVRLRSLADKALKGDVRAAGDLLKYAERAGLIPSGEDDEGTCGITVVVPKEWDWLEWHANFEKFGLPPWDTDPDGLVPPERRKDFHG